MFWRNMYASALKTYKELQENSRFAHAHSEIGGRVSDLERCISVLDAIVKSVLKSKGKKRTIYLEDHGSVFAEIFDVQEYTILAYEKGRGNFEIPLTDLTTNSLLLYAKKNLAAGKAETEMALGTFVLSRGLVKQAEEFFFRAAKKGAPNEEVARLLERLEEKPPATIEEVAEVPDNAEAKENGDSQKIYAQAEEMFKKRKYADALSLYKKLLKRFPDSEVVAQNKSGIDGNIAVCEDKLSSPLARTFSGKVVGRDDLGKGVIEVSYDFEDEKQLADWKEYNWYSIFDMHDSNWHVVNGELSGNGSHGYLWKGEIDGDVKVEFDAYSTSGDRQNIQATICDNGEGWNYLFAVGLTELGNAKDIIRRNEKFSFGKEIAKRPSDAKSFKTYHVKIIKKGSQLSLYVDDKLLLRASHNLYKKGHVGLFAIGSTVRFDNITITGKLDKEWLKKYGK
jgi:tetratricopeptide (TPR) repeat protein